MNILSLSLTIKIYYSHLHIYFRLANFCVEHYFRQMRWMQFDCTLIFNIFSFLFFSFFLKKILLIDVILRNYIVFNDIMLFYYWIIFLFTTVVGLFVLLSWTVSCCIVAQQFWGRRVGIGLIETHLKSACAQTRTPLLRSWSRAHDRRCYHKNVIVRGHNIIK